MVRQDVVPNLGVIWRNRRDLRSDVPKLGYPTLADFQQTVSSLLNNAHETHREELDSLLALRFQTFGNLIL